MAHRGAAVPPAADPNIMVKEVGGYGRWSPLGHACRRLHRRRRAEGEAVMGKPREIAGRKAMGAKARETRHASPAAIIGKPRETVGLQSYGAVAAQGRYARRVAFSKARETV